MTKKGKTVAAHDVLHVDCNCITKNPRQCVTYLEYGSRYDSC